MIEMKRFLIVLISLFISNLFDKSTCYNWDEVKQGGTFEALSPHDFSKDSMFEYVATLEKEEIVKRVQIMLGIAQIWYQHNFGDEVMKLHQAIKELLYSNKSYAIRDIKTHIKRFLENKGVWEWVIDDWIKVLFPELEIEYTGLTGDEEFIEM